MLQELVNVLIEVEHDCDADNQNDGEEISAEKLADDVASRERGKWSDSHLNEDDLLPTLERRERCWLFFFSPFL